MISEASGNLLSADAEALVNTVNTEGVMGKGIALQFRRAYPAMYEAYREAARAGEIRLGRVQVWPTQQLTGPKFIINFPTKGHWKSRSRLHDIETGLVNLVDTVRELGISSIAVPPLGCGNGGLDWSEVEPRIRAAFADLPGIEVSLYAPAGAPSAATMRIATKRPNLTLGRAALIDVVHRYTRQALMAPGLIESQKLMYFLQAAGEPLRLRFVASHYGPYADNLRHVLSTVEGHYLSGFGDGSARVTDAEPLSVLPGALPKAESVLSRSVETRARIERVLSLADGFESAYGLELLSTVHWLAVRDDAVNDADLTQQVWDWSPRKARMFTADHVGTALGRLRSERWLPEPAA